MVLKRLFVLDPRVRGSCRDIIAILSAGVEKSHKKISAITSFFSTSTNSWVKLLTDDSDTPLDTDVLHKLLSKAAIKPNKIPKFFISLEKRPKYKPKICLRSLAVLHNYLFVTIHSLVTKKSEDFLDGILKV